MNLRLALHLLVLSSGLLAALRGPVQGAASGPDQPLRYARVSAEGSAIRNLADDKGKEICNPAKGALVAVFKEGTTGWLEVEVPGGFAVWVFGKYLQPTATEGLFEVVGNAINLRPGPSSDLSTDVNNFPLPQRLQAGDSMRLIELQDPSKPLAETWARVWSPPGVRGFLRAGQVADLAASEDGPSLWRAALAAVPSVPPVRAAQASLPAPSAVEKELAEGALALEEARALLERERAKEMPDYDPVEAALNSVVARGGTVALEARAELRTLATLREAAALRADLERERQRRAQEVLEEQKRVWERSREKDPFGGVFAARGVVERRTTSDGIARFYLRFGGEISCELVCSSGRYDFSTFAGTEVGILGSEITSRTGEVPTFEVARVEVLAVR
jgi:hypothetical protein